MRYAKALFAYAKEQGAEDAIYSNMLQLMLTLQRVKELGSMLVAPSLSKNERVKLLCSAVESSSVYEDFIRLVVSEEREPLLIFIAHCYLDPSHPHDCFCFLGCVCVCMCVCVFY